MLVIDMIAQLCTTTGNRISDLIGIGISIAAFITAEGVTTATAHLSPEWVGFDLKAALAVKLPSNYYFALDTPAPTLGEGYFGAGMGIDHFVYVTVSTGIGAGIMNKGQYFIGGLGWAGGLGHIIIDEKSERVCQGCGNRGCLETFAATQGIIATTKEFATRYPESLLHSLLNGDLERITPAIVYEAAKQNDPAASAVWEYAGHALGIGLTNLTDIVSPGRIVVGGGISQAGDFLLEPARKVVRERAFPPQHRHVEIVQAALGDLSGMYGAAAMVFYDTHINS